ncbi:MAG: aldehyde dehydrogenase family protein [Candidatus Poribacteria bacterium]|nr:aldehyde dehydrogenase family protein [Candidatus Poribacteria bacterium]
MRMHIGGEWVDKSQKIDVLNPFDGSVVDTVPKGDRDDIEKALQTAERGAKIMAKMTGYERYEILHKVYEMMAERVDALARTITLEEGKTLVEATMEASRAAEIIALSAEEAKRLYGEVIPLEGAPGVKGKFGFTVRVPCGIVAGISPFNFPLHLVCHKVGPALAAGNAIIVKPATDTPLSALKLVELFLEAGTPPEAIQCVTGPGGEIGDTLCADRRVRKITFTGSRDVGEHICHVAGLKRVTMELGSNSPLIVMPDADPEKVAQAAAASGYSNAGQVCISTQRVIAHEQIYGDFLDAFKSTVAGISTGNPLDEPTKMGPMIRETDAIRVSEWVQDAVKDGAELLTGGERNGQFYAPTIVANVKPEMKISCDEVFGPVVSVTRVDNIDDAIALANDTNYGLSAAIFTQNIDWAMKFVREVDSGNLMVNWGTQWRADLMPYGGLKESGMGKEGPKYAVQEMTETKMAIFHLSE